MLWALLAQTVLCSALGGVCAPAVPCSATVDSATPAVCETATEAEEAAPEVSVYDDAVALWRLDEQGGTRADSIGSLDLTDNGTVHWANLGPAAVVAEFSDAANEFLGKTSFTASDSWTVAGWFRPTETAGGVITAIGSWPNGVQLSVDFTDGSMVRVVAGDGSTLVTASAIAPMGDWRFFVASYRASDKKVRISVDNRTVSVSSALSGTAYRTPATLKINSNDGPATLDMRASRFGLWSRDLFETPDDVESIYNAGFGKAYADLTTAEKVDLVSYWDLSEASGNRADSHGSNTLTDNETVASTTNSYPANLPGIISYHTALETEYFSLADSAAFDFNGGGFTVAGWVRLVSGDIVLSKDDGTTEREWSLVGDTWTVFQADATSASAAATVDDTDWHLFIVWFDESDGKVRTQIDDGSVTTSAGTLTGVQNQAAEFWLGRHGSTYVNGHYSSVAIWDRALTADERAELWNSGDGAPLP